MYYDPRIAIDLASRLPFSPGSLGSRVGFPERPLRPGHGDEDRVPAPGGCRRRRH